MLPFDDDTFQPAGETTHEKHTIYHEILAGYSASGYFSIFKTHTVFFPFKDRFPALIRSSVVYQFKCPGCHALYFGKTTRHLITRCREHLGMNKAGQKIKVSPSAIWDHINKSGHAASMEDFQFWTELTMILICSFMKVY